VNQIILNNSTLPVVCGCDFCVAAEPFFHTDRIVDFNVMIYVTDGQINVTEEDNGVQTDYCVTPGRLLFLKSGLRHLGKKVCPKGTSWFFVHFITDPRTAPLLNESSEPLRQYERAEYSAILPKSIADEKLSAQLRNLVDFFHHGGNRAKWELNARFFAFLSGLIKKEEPSKKISKADEIAAFLLQNYNKPFSAKSLERHFFLSYKHMAAQFKREKNITMQQYHTRIRMEEAEKLLRSTALSIGEISERLGFSDMLYFSRCFHAFVGESPTAYRRRSVENY